eukprot:4943277-Pyramimonas_sp.AAC.1
MSACARDDARVCTSYRALKGCLKTYDSDKRMRAHSICCRGWREGGYWLGCGGTNSYLGWTRG